MNDKEDRPQLRILEIVPAVFNNEQMLVLKDPLRLSEDIVTIPEDAAAMLSFLDGTNTVLDIQAALTRATGQIVPSEPIRAFIEALNSKYLLDNERYRQRVKEVNSTFIKVPVRPGVCQGIFPEDADHCTKLLDRYATNEAGPGPIGAAEDVSSDDEVLGIIAPHIDYQRGGACYAHAYSKLAHESNATTFVVLGTDHQGLALPASVSDKAYASPYGNIEVDMELYERLSGMLGGDVGDPIAHRQEHSIELAVVWLGYIGRKAGREIKILPILLGGFTEQIEAGEPPDSDPGLAALLQALRQSAAAHSAPLAFVASADLAHIGPQFGGQRHLTESDLKQSADADKSLLDTASGGSADAFYEEVAREKDVRHICGLAPIYAMLACLHDVQGEMLQYGQWRDDHGLASVSFASMAFRKRKGQP